MKRVLSRARHVWQAPGRDGLERRLLLVGFLLSTLGMLVTPGIAWGSAGSPVALTVLANVLWLVGVGAFLVSMVSWVERSVRTPSAGADGSAEVLGHPPRVVVPPAVARPVSPPPALSTSRTVAPPPAPPTPRPAAQPSVPAAAAARTVSTAVPSPATAPKIVKPPARRIRYRERPVVLLVAVSALVCIVLGALYLAVDATDLPSFMPRSEADIPDGSREAARGVALLGVGVVLLLGAWRSSITREIWRDR